MLPRYLLVPFAKEVIQQSICDCTSGKYREDIVERGKKEYNLFIQPNFLDIYLQFRSQERFGPFVCLMVRAHFHDVTTIK